MGLLVFRFVSREERKKLFMLWSVVSVVVKVAL